MVHRVNTPGLLRSRAASLAALVLLAMLTPTGCRENPVDATMNKLPAAVLGDAGSQSASTPAPASDVEEGTVADTESFLLDCIKIETLGSAGPTDLQTQFLGVAWTADIKAFKLNVMFEILERSEETGASVFQLRSGIGAGPAEMCAHPDTDSPAVGGQWMVSEGDMVPEVDPDRLDDGFCMVDLEEGAAAGPFAGKTHFQLTADEAIWIYAEDNDKTPYNCTPDDRPDAVPLRAAAVDITIGEDALTAAGRMNGCLSLEEATKLCSCIGTCAAQGPEDLQTEGPCAGCPKGGQPLADQLAGIVTTEHCTEVMGEDAFDLIVSFSAKRLPKTPDVCE